LAQYCSRFIPTFATIASPLWDLTKSHAKWQWGTAEEKVFQEVKMQLTQAPVMAFFKQGAETHVTTDASPVSELQRQFKFTIRHIPGREKPLEMNSG